MTETHRDELRDRALQSTRSKFSFFTAPCMPKQYRRTDEERVAQSKPNQIMRACFSTEFLKENLPS